MTDRHEYVSTACFHELHEHCRKTCKFCSAPCLCWCHIKSRTETVSEVKGSGDAI